MDEERITPMDEETRAYLTAVDEYLSALHKDLEWRLSVFTLPAPPVLSDYLS